MDFIKPKHLPEANIQAELYRHLRNDGIKCCLEYRMYVEEFNTFCRADLIIIKGKKIIAIIECKSRDNNFEVNKGGKQFRQYKTFGIPIFYCMNFKHVERTLNLIKLLITQGTYKPEYIQTFKSVEKKKTSRQESKQEKRNTLNDNWDLLLASNLQYNCFSRTHVRICNKVDFWPTSGKWMVLGEYSSRVGFNEMKKFILTNT